MHANRYDFWLQKYKEIIVIAKLLVLPTLSVHWYCAEILPSGRTPSFVDWPENHRLLSGKGDGRSHIGGRPWSVAWRGDVTSNRSENSVLLEIVITEDNITIVS